MVTHDQRGHGASAATSDYSSDAFRADLRAVRDALALEHPLLVGHSFGGCLPLNMPPPIRLRGCRGRGRRSEGRAATGRVGGGPAQLDRPVTRLLSRVATAATRFQQLHPEVKLARLACGHAIPLERPKELADLIIGFAESLPARS